MHDQALRRAVWAMGRHLRRWVRTYAASGDRRRLRASFARGLAAGVRTSPRPNEQVLPN